MQLWSLWWSMVAPLRQACSYSRSFLWVATSLAGLCARPDLLGVTSIVRALSLTAKCYDRLLDNFHSKAVDVDALSRLWTRQVLKVFSPFRLQGRPVFLGDGLKVPKSGLKMPAVKRLHQASDNNTKPEYIFGHSIQAIGVLVAAAGSYFAVPLTARIHEGVKFTNRDQRSLPQKFCTLIDSLGLSEPFVLIADAYYACTAVCTWAFEQGCTLISRLRRNAVAYELPAPPQGPRKRGRPRLYGRKIKLRTLFDGPESAWQSAASPVYGERDVTLRYQCLDLIWRPLRRLVRFVLVDHPTRGRCIFLCTDLTLPALQIIEGYGLRFKIELSFKQALRVVGAYAYHFWMAPMRKITRKGGTQFLHRASERYRIAVRRKLAAYHRHIQLGLIAQGLLQYLAVTAPQLVWNSFGSWLRTIRPGLPPSELVTTIALRHALPQFLAHSPADDIFTKFLRDRLDPGQSVPWRLAS
ncbi:MAG: transposase [Pseudomonadota bacterium]